jgi:aspartyl-tRNA(Asn)/glutamyl-tRNA(Gln) amidotransferase subunit A
VPDWTVDGLNATLAAGNTNCTKLVEAALARAGDPRGEGCATFRGLRADEARSDAAAQERLRNSGHAASPLAGLPVSIKDNIDVAGEPTRAGSRLLEDVPPAKADATVVGRLRAAGAVIVGRSNMSELAFSGLGYNRFYGTPANPWERATRRIPGGSSSGAAISVTDEMAVAAIGTDTGGSVRIPAALTGLAGFKPTQSRVPRDGVLPLSTLLDTVGPLARKIADCALLDSILAAAERTLAPFHEPLNLCTADDFMLQDADEAVSSAYARAKDLLRRSGARMDALAPGAFDEVPQYAGRGSFSSEEAWARFGERIRARPRDLDPRIAERILRGRDITAADHAANVEALAAMQARFERGMRNFDALMAPTVPIVAPPIADMEDDEKFRRANALILRNPMVANLLDAPSLTIPCHAPGAAPVGLMLIGPRLSDRRLLAIGAAIERLLMRAISPVKAGAGYCGN